MAENVAQVQAVDIRPTQEQADLGFCHLLEQGLGLDAVFAVEIPTQARLAMIGRRFDHVGVLLERLEPEQPIVVRRPLL